MKHEEIKEIFDKLRNKVIMADEHAIVESRNITECEYCQFSDILESMLDEILTDSQVMKLINLVNKH